VVVVFVDPLSQKTFQQTKGEEAKGFSAADKN